MSDDEGAHRRSSSERDRDRDRERDRERDRDRDRDRDRSRGGRHDDDDRPHHRGRSGTQPMRAPLKAREHVVDLDSKVGKTQVVSAKTRAAGYYCDVCDCTLSDSANYLDHINGKKHQRALGMSMRAERSSVSDVKARMMEKLKRKHSAITPEEEIRQRIQKEEEADEERKRRRKEKKEEKREKKREEKRGEAKGGGGGGGEEDEEEDAMLAAMGLPSSFTR